MGAVRRQWGRNAAPGLWTVIMTAMIGISSPIFTIAVWNIIHQGDGSFGQLIQKATTLSIWSMLPKPSLQGAALFIGWLSLQALLYVYLPAPIAFGQETPAGHVLPYRVNGLFAWILCNAGFVVFGMLKLFPLSIIADNWEGLLVITNVYGYLLTAFVYAKAQLAPSHPDDRKFTGSWLYDMFMGIELNPRFGKLFDFKLFHNGRPGIVAWTMINMSFAAAQYNRFGYVTDSMILVNALQMLYVVDFFVHEDWYLKTIDIAHDHFGFYLAWGDSVWLPFMYTLQSQYLAYHPVKLGTHFYLILGAGILGYCIFREANFQKDVCRRTDGKCEIWGKPAKILRTTYQSIDGKLHHSLLLVSGFWGMARHCNYLGDLILSASMCFACGFTNLIPHFYIIYMTILLTHRIERDHARCSGKYGEYWETYSKLVPHKLIPGIY